MTDFADLGIRVDSRGAVSGERDLDKLSKTASRTGGAVAALGRQFVVAGAAMAASFGGRAIVRQIEEFETAMSGVAAVTRASAKDLSALRDVAREMGASTEFSASQAADGLRFLGMAGFSAQEAIASLGDTLNLATASGMGLAQAADIASNIMSGFGIAASDAATVTDVLAAASSRSNTDVSQLGEAMKFAAPVAKAMGISIQDTAAAIGTLSDAGLQGSQAGTGLRAVLASLSKPSKDAEEYLDAMGVTLKDINPEAVGLSEALGLLYDNGLNAQAAMAIFGREAASAGLVLAESARRFGEFGDELGSVQGEAQRMADTMRDNLGGDLKTLGSTVSGLILELGEAGLTDILRTVVKVVAGAITVITDLVKAFGFVTDKIHNAASVLLGFGRTSVSTQKAIDNVSLSLADEAIAIDLVNDSIPAGIELSKSAAKSKLNEARAIYEKIEAERLEAQQEVMLSSAYKGTAREIKVLSAITKEFTANSERNGGIFAPNAAREGLETNIRLLQRAYDEQRRLLSAADVMPDAYEKSKTTIKRLEESIASATGGVVVMTGEVVKLGERGEISFDDLADAASKSSKSIKDAEDAAKKYTDTMSGYFVDGMNDAVDWMLDGFKGGLGSLWKIFTGTIKQMIAFALKNQIMLSMGIGGSAIGGAASAATGAGGGGIFSGLASTLIGGFGPSAAVGGGVGATLGSLAGGTGLIGGAGNVIAGIASGGLAGGGAAIGTALGGATASMAGFATALGAVALPLLAVAAIFSFFKTKTKILDTGLQVNIENIDATVQAFKKVEKSKFWGLSKKISTELDDVADETASPVLEAVYNIQKGIIDAADYLGIGAEAFDAFSTQLKISFKDLKTDEEKSRAIQDALEGLGDEFAGMIVGIDDLSKSGEGAAATLTRLVQSVATVNQWWDRLGFSLYDLSLAGADAASTIVALYGDIETFTSLSGAYYQNFFTQQERTAQAIKEVSASLADLGVGALPASRDAFRALVEAAEIAGNDSLVAGLLKISGAFAEITTASDALAQSLDQSQFTTRAAFEFAKSTLAQGGTDAYESTDTLLLRQLVDAVKQGNLKIIQNTGDTARILTRQDLAPTETVV